MSNGVTEDRLNNLTPEIFAEAKRIASKYTDSDGNQPCVTFFYPEEEYDPELLEKLAGLCRSGIGDVEIHLHHDHDTAKELARKLNGFKKILHETHGLLRLDEGTNEIVYAFIHGNWALDNSRPDGRWCGVSNEIQVLVDTGCYMDMTLPAGNAFQQSIPAQHNAFIYVIEGGLEVVGTASDGRMAVDKFREINPDIVTLDIQMPLMNGLETLKALLKIRPVPVPLGWLL